MYQRLLWTEICYQREERTETLCSLFEFIAERASGNTSPARWLVLVCPESLGVSGYFK